MGKTNQDRGVVLNTNRARSARYALQDLYCARLDTCKRVSAMMPSLRIRWYRLLSDLTDVGYFPTRDARRRGYMASCPPVGVGPVPGEQWKAKKTCNKGLVCPFCYVREYVFNAYDRLAPLTLWDRPYTCSLFLTTRTYDLDVAEMGLLDALRAANGLIGSPARRLEVNAFRPIGAVVMHRIRPAAEEMMEFEGPTRTIIKKITVVRTTLMVADTRKPVPPLIDTKLIRIDNPYRYHLASLVGRAFSYPRLWYAVPATLVVSMVAAMARARVFASYGACRARVVDVPESTSPEELNVSDDYTYDYDETDYETNYDETDYETDT